MKLINKITGFTLAAIAGFGLSACTNDLNENSLKDPSGVLKLVHTPDVTAWSGDQVLTAGTRGNAGDGYIGNSNWEKFDTDGLENITQEERNKVLDAIAEKTQNGTRGQISEDIVFPWENYFLQDVVTMEDGNYTNAGKNGMKDISVSNLEAYSKGKYCYHGSDNENYEEVTNSKKMNQYFQKQKGEQQERISQTTLMTDMTVGTYDEMKGRQFRVWINCHINGHYDDYITVQVDGNWYVCFDFGCGDEEHDKDGDPGKDPTYNDWDYNDWVIKITEGVPVNGKNTPVWDGKEEDETCDKCGHKKHDPRNCPEEECEHPSCHPAPDDLENCPLCDHPIILSNGIWVHYYDFTLPGEVCSICIEDGKADVSPCSDEDLQEEMQRRAQGEETPNPTPGNTPNTGNNYKNRHNNEVEVNYSINDVHMNGNEQKYANADLWTKLSIHVRKGTDVKITIPLPSKYLCESDDLVILEGHEIGFSSPTAQTENRTTYTIKKQGTDNAETTTWTVTLEVKFNETNIEITTTGITQELIDYLMEKNGDGINFEIWNYFQEDTVAKLMAEEGFTAENYLEKFKTEFLDKSTIEFVTADPNYYINAFGYKYVNGVSTGEQNPSHCTVKPDDEKFDQLAGKYHHLNSTPYNDIWVKKGMTPDATHSDN